MKFRLLITLLVVLPMYGTFAQGIDFFQGTLAEAKEKAKQENKLVFVDAYTTWCGPCKWMNKNIFTLEEVGAFYNENFVSIKLDMEKEGDGLTSKKDYNVRVFPTLLYIDGDGKLMHRVTGTRNAAGFIALGKTALDPEERYAAHHQKYVDGNRDPEFIKSYLLLLEECGVDSKEVADWHFSTLSNEDLLTKENFELFSRIVKSPDHNFFKFVMENYDQYTQIVGAAELNFFIEKPLLRSIAMAFRTGEETYKVTISEAKATGYPYVDKLAEIFQMKLKLARREYSEYADIMLEHVKKYEWDNARKLQEYANDFIKYAKITDKKYMDAALLWIERSMELRNSYGTMYLKAQLLYKAGNSKKALVTATEALATAKEEGKNTEQIEVLIEKINKGT